MNNFIKTNLSDNDIYFIQIEALYANANLLIDWCNELDECKINPALWNHHDIELIVYQMDKLQKLINLIKMNKQCHELNLALSHANYSLQNAEEYIEKYKFAKARLN